MSRWLALVAIAAVVAVAGAGVVALARPAAPQASCALPGNVTCTDDTFCVGFGAVCNTAVSLCVCTGDGGVDAGLDGGASDLGGRSDLGGDGGSVVNPGPGVGPVTGGGGTTTPKEQQGCSYVPGRAL